MSQADWFARRVGYLQALVPGVQAAYGSNAWNIMTALSQGDANHDALIQQGVQNASLAYAVGPALYALGAGYGVFLQPAVYATAPLVFTLNPVNASAATTIPAGSVVMTPSSSGQAAVQFTTLADATIPANTANSNTVTGQCAVTGLAGNVPTGSVILPYSGVPGGVTVTNPAAGGSAGYVAGAPPQTDASYRASVYDAIQNKTAAARIEGVAKQTTGTFGSVFAAKVIDAADTHGNYTCYVSDIDGNASSPLQSAVQANIAAMGNIGLTLTVAALTLVTQNIVGTYTLQPGAVDATVKAALIVAMQAWGNTLPSGVNLLPTDLLISCYGGKPGIPAVAGVLDLNIATPSAPLAATDVQIIRLGSVTLSAGSI